MTYKTKIVELEGGKNTDGTPFMVKRYYILSYDREPKDDDPYLSVWADGSLTLKVDKFDWKVHLYDDQWLAMIKVIKQAMQDKAEAKRLRIEKWLAENGDKTQLYGASVTWSINEAKKILAEAPIRWGEDWYGKVAEIQIGDQWLHLCRTDLMDDICTGSYEDAGRSLEENRKHYLEHVRYGARRTKDGIGFAVVDQVSDG